MNNTEGKGGRGIGEGVGKQTIRNCCRCLGMIGKNQSEIANALRVSIFTAKRQLRRVQRPERVHPAMKCCMCLKSVGLGYRIITRFTAVPRSTVRRMLSGSSNPELKRGNLNWGKEKQPSHRVNAWAQEWKGVLKWDECGHWADLYWGREISRRHSLLKYQSMSQTERRERNRKLTAAQKLSGSRARSHARWKSSNPEKVRAQARKDALKWRAANPDKIRDAKRKWIQLNPNKYREQMRRAGRRKLRRDIDTLSDRYIRDLLRDGSSLKRHDIPQSLVELKREHLRLIRLVKQTKETHTT